MNVVFSAIGSRGDIQPMLGLALESKSRGHKVTLCAPPNYQEWIESYGIHFAPLGVDYKQYSDDNPENSSGNPWTIYKGVKAFFHRHLPQQFNDLMIAAKDADMLIYGGMAFVAPSVADALSIPSVSIVYSTCMIPSDIHPPAIVPTQTFPSWLNKLAWMGNHFAANSVISSALNQCRKSVNLPAKKFSQQFYDDSNFIIAADTELLPLDVKWENKHKSVGFIFLEDTRDLDEELKLWLSEGEPPIYISFGSMQGPGLDRIASFLYEALVDLDKRFLIGSGWGNLSKQTLPENCKVIGDVSHDSLHPHISLAIHHGGSGTMAKLLRNNVPQVIVPLILDQYYHAHQLHKLGLIPKPIPMEIITATEFQNSIIAGLSIQKSTYAVISEKIQSSQAAKKAVNYIEHFAKKSRFNLMQPNLDFTLSL